MSANGQHKKGRQAFSKPRQIQDADGWTHIVKGPRASSVSLSEITSTVLDPAEIEAKHAEFTRKWKASTTCQQIRAYVEQHLFPRAAADLRVDRCICLGLGSFTTDASVRCAYRDSSVSLSQLVAFESWAELLRSHFPIDRIVIQDPAFAASDRRFLAARGYEVVETPAAEALVTARTFLFAPFPPRDLVPSVLANAHPVLAVAVKPLFRYMCGREVDARGLACVRWDALEDEMGEWVRKFVAVRESWGMMPHFEMAYHWLSSLALYHPKASDTT